MTSTRRSGVERRVSTAATCADAFHWREVDDGRQGLAQTSDHLPELVLNNFNTRLGHNVGRVFASVFPQMAEFHGRRVVTFHNQRDFIFFRHHRCDSPKLPSGRVLYGFSPFRSCLALLRPCVAAISLPPTEASQVCVQ